jgi:hypothetical protein
MNRISTKLLTRHRWQSPLSDELAARVRDLFSASQPTRGSTAATGKGKADGSGAGGPRGGGPESLPELVTRLRHQVMEKGGTQTRH